MALVSIFGFFFLSVALILGHRFFFAFRLCYPFFSKLKKHLLVCLEFLLVLFDQKISGVFFGGLISVLPLDKLTQRGTLFPISISISISILIPIRLPPLFWGVANILGYVWSKTQCFTFVQSSGKPNVEQIFKNNKYQNNNNYKWSRLRRARRRETNKLTTATRAAEERAEEET